MNYLLSDGPGFAHGRKHLTAWLDAHRRHALDHSQPPCQPIVYRFHRVAWGSRVLVAAGVEYAEVERSYVDGAPGVDLNEHHVAVTRADPDGDPAGT